MIIFNIILFQNVYNNSFIVIFIFIYLSLAALGLCCCARAFSGCSDWGPLLTAVHGPLILVASLVAEHGL